MSETYDDRLEAAIASGVAFTCEACGSHFLSIKQLAGHQNAHANESFVCEHCGFRCRASAGLRSHLRAHVRQQMHRVTSGAQCVRGGQ